MTLAELVSHTKAFLRQRQTAYQTTFAGPGGERVLADLAKFCRAYKTTYHEDPYIAARLDGRREVFLRVQAHLQLNDEQLWKLFGRSDIDHNP
jgi:hypothetical protein